MWESSHELYAYINSLLIWGSSLEFYVLHIPYRCKVQKLDALQHNTITNSETEI